MTTTLNNIEYLEEQFEKLDKFIRKNNLDCEYDGGGVIEESGGTEVYMNEDYKVMVGIEVGEDGEGDLYYVTVFERFDNYETVDKTVKSLQSVKNNLKKYFRR